MSRTLFAVAAGAAFGFAGLVAADEMLDAEPPPRAVAPLVDRFPNVELQTHDGRTVRFYDDLLEGKIVALNFMYATCTDF